MKKSLLIITLTIITVATMVYSQPNKKVEQNPFTLVYEGAITENVKGKVNIHPVIYKIREITIAANVYTPPNYDASKKYPAVAVAHPNGGVKEQVAGLYAQRLAEQGYITITADAAYQGASDGQPRGYYQEKGKPKQIVRTGDVVRCLPGVEHWHGASAETGVTYIAINPSQKGRTIWGKK